jgi:hypothetical protein
MLAARANAVPALKDLMKAVACSQASAEQLEQIPDLNGRNEPEHSKGQELDHLSGQGGGFLCRGDGLMVKVVKQCSLREEVISADE